MIDRRTTAQSGRQIALVMNPRAHICTRPEPADLYHHRVFPNKPEASIYPIGVLL